MTNTLRLRLAKKLLSFADELAIPKVEEVIASRLFCIAKDVLAGEGDMCGKKGCIRKVGDKWKIMSGKTGKFWPQNFNDKATAEKVLARYHGWGF